jgi:kanamycin nucleotidyltransferase
VNCSNVKYPSPLPLPRRGRGKKHGPQPISAEERRQNAQEIAQALQAHYGERLLALGIYGSLGRGTDGPYSDIEMHCIVQGEGIDECFEWSTGPWKAEVDVYSPEVILGLAAEVEGDWAITHGAYVKVLPVFDPGGFFPRLKETVLSQPEEVFRWRMKEVIIGDLYELVGKARNAWAAQTLGCLPEYALHLARGTAGLLGLAQRYLFSSSTTFFEEALRLPEQPAGFEALCRRVMSGKLSSPRAILREINALWEGLELWAQEQGIELHESLEGLLEEENAR